MKTEHMKELFVLDLFFTETNNTISAIAKQVEISEARVNKIITKYLKNKTINESKY